MRYFLKTILILGVTTLLYSGEDFSPLPAGFMPFEEFAKEFALGSASTEQLHPATKHLSQIMHKSVLNGMELLLTVDENVIKGLASFIPSIKTFAPVLAEKIGAGGRVFLVGSGSSGRVGVDIAAKCNSRFPQAKEQVRGVIAGGDSALIRAKEGFEDSEAEGEAALKEYKVGPQDTVILISASGSSSFNVGCGHFSANQGAQVFYFFNSREIPSRTERLFDRTVNPVIPLCIDIGPQAIGGSTRLQGATLAEACLGSFLATAFYLNQGEELLAQRYPLELLSKMQVGIELIKSHLSCIQQFAQIEAEVFANPHSNFRQLKDITNQGYVTFIALEDSIREVLIDSTETSPTFSTNPIRRESEIDKKRAEFQAYLLGKESNNEAWKALLGREVYPLDKKDTQAFLLACEEEGVNAYAKRPIGKGNFLIGVVKIDGSASLPKNLLPVLAEAKKQGGATGLLVFCRGKFSEAQTKELRDAYDAVLVMENIPADAMGFSETMVVKQVLNLISNSSMVLMNKVHGNQMIDVRASNKKLIDRCIRLSKEIWNEYQPDCPLDDKTLYHYVAHVSAAKKCYEEKGIYTPSAVKLVLAMLALKKTPEDMQEVIEFLNKKQERIDWIGEIKDNSFYTLCIEGGGSKTILQVIDQEGQVVPLMQNGRRRDKIEAGSSNINAIGPEGVREVLRSLFEDVLLVQGERELPLIDLIPDSHIIAGMAGAAVSQNKQTLLALFEEWEIKADHILVMGDAEMALHLIEGEGIILIAGTGSICLGKKEETLFRVGGLGRVLGDEGSGYYMGLQALKAALAEEYGWGATTSLTPALKELFNGSDLKSLIPKIHLGEISPAKIASIAPLVFTHAWEKDRVAEKIINDAAHHLSYLLATMLSTSPFSHCEVHLWGGIFKNVHAEDFIQKIVEGMPDPRQDLKIINKAKDNPALLFALQKLCAQTL